MGLDLTVLDTYSSASCNLTSSRRALLCRLIVATVVSARLCATTIIHLCLRWKGWN